MWKIVVVLITALALTAGCKTDSSTKAPATPDQIQPAAEEGAKAGTEAEASGAEEPSTTDEAAPAEEAKPAGDEQPAPEATKDVEKEKKKAGSEK